MAVTSSEVACLVHSWLTQQGLSKTATTFMIEAKHMLQAVSVNGSIRNLGDILSDYATLKATQIEKSKVQKAFFDDEQNEDIFIDIWNQFNSLISDYKYYKKNHHQADPRHITHHNKRKRRRLNDFNDYDNNENLFELNTNRFNEILHNSALHEKMAELIQSEYNKNNNHNQNKSDHVVDRMLAIDESQFTELFVPLPIEQYEQQEDANMTSNSNTVQQSDANETENTNTNTNSCNTKAS
eukprot:232836_1